MNFRKSLKSMHHSSSNKKIQLNQLDLQQCNHNYIQGQQSTKQSENSILNKLLLQPPSMKNNINNQNNNKLLLNSSNNVKKYQPRFDKPDVQNLIQQNINLKNVIQSNNQHNNILKIKNNQLQRKIKLLEKGLDKIQSNNLFNNNRYVQGDRNINIDLKNNKDVDIRKMGIKQQKQNNRQQKPIHNIQNSVHNNYNIVNNNKYTQGNKQNNNNIDNNKVPSNNVINNYKFNNNINNNYTQVYNKTGYVHTQILKKKIVDLTAINISSQNQLKYLKRLPNITIYEQNDVQKQHLIAQTIRLKSIITSLAQQHSSLVSNNNNEINNNNIVNNNNNSLNNNNNNNSNGLASNSNNKQQSSQKFQNQFMRMMKQQNQKLKATIRLLENDKILLKSRQTIQNKLNSDLKKQIEHLKSKLLFKQSQLEKINNQNKNLLFKKTTQFKHQQQKKQNQIILELKNILENKQLQIQKNLQNNEFLSEENINLKDKQKILSQEISEIQTKYDKLVKKLNQDIQELQFQLNNVKSDYMNLLNSGALKKKKSLGISKQPSNIHSSNALNLRESFHSPQTINQKYHHLTTSNNNLYFRPVKWEDITLPIAHIYITLDQNPFLTVQSLIKNVQEHDQVKCGDLVGMLIDEPFNINKKQAIKLGRYICEDSAQANTKILYNQNISIQSSLAKTILSSSLGKVSSKLSSNFLNEWYKIFKKTKKLSSIIQSFIDNKLHVRKDELVQTIDKYSRQKVELEQYQFMTLKCFDKQLSDQEFVFSSQKIKQWINEVMNDYNLDKVPNNLISE